ncbi:hypothetical protein SNEBB_003317 [Seison nebaliae]|nr:hypothetical protein SNEBB_003317 [Seison nebaliae]
MEKKELELFLMGNNPPAYEEQRKRKKGKSSRTLSFVSFLLFLMGLCCLMLAMEIRLHKKDLSIKFSPSVMEYRFKQWLYPGLHFYHLKFNPFLKLHQPPTPSSATVTAVTGTNVPFNILIKRLIEVNQNKYVFDNIGNNNNDDVEVSGGSVDSNNIGSDDKVGSGNHNDQNYQFKIKGNNDDIINNGNDNQQNETTYPWSSTQSTSTYTWWTSKSQMKKFINPIINNIWNQIHEMKNKKDSY